MYLDDCYVYYSDDAEYANCRHCDAPEWEKHRDNCSIVIALNESEKYNEKINSILKELSLYQGHKEDNFFIWCEFCRTNIADNAPHKNDCAVERARSILNG